jgi:hypothetical protein
VILNKPFYPIEIQQLACTLSLRWHGLRERDRRLRELERAAHLHDAA